MGMTENTQSFFAPYNIFFFYQRMTGSSATPRKSLKNIDKVVTADTFLGKGKSTHDKC